MNHNYNCDERQRFSLRKLTVGLASVLVGLTLFGYSQATSQTVHAATTGQSDPNATYDESGSAISIPGGPTLDPDGNPIDKTIDVNYGANDQTQTIHYKDDKGDPAKDANGQKIPDGQVTGKTDDQDKTVPMPNGWKPKDPNTDGKTNLDNPDPTTGNVPDKNVTIEHGQHTTAPGETHKKGDPIIKDAPGSTDTATQTGPENKYQEDINKEDVTKDLTRTITVNKPTGNVTVDAQGHQTVASTAEDHSETVAYNRTTTVDDVTGKVVDHGDWQLADPAKNKFDAFTVPNVDGYTPNPATIDENQAPTDQNGINNYTDPKIVINYTANNQHVNYVFKDGNTTVKTGTVNGVTDQTVTDQAAQLDAVLKQLRDAGYDTSKVNFASYKLNATNNPDIVIDLNHSSVTPNGQDIDPDTGKTIDEMTHVDRTYGITVYSPNADYDGYNSDYHEERDFKLTRTATKDAVTGKITYGKWTGTVTGKTNGEIVRQGVWYAALGTHDGSSTWDSYVNNGFLALGMPFTGLSSEKGYTIQVPEDVAIYKLPDNTYRIDFNKAINYDDVLHTTSDPLTWIPSKNIDIYVNADKQSSSWKFVDDTGVSGVIDQAVIAAHNEVLKTHEFNGYTDQTISLSIAVPSGYKLADNASIPTNYTFHAENNQPIEIHLVHEVKTAIDKNHIPDGAKKSDGSNVTPEDFSETVTRHITINMPNHDGKGGINASDKTQTKTLTRTGDYDAVTKVMTFSPWSKDTFEAVPVPEVAGYTPSQNTIDAADATDGFVDPKITINYTAQDSSQTIHYVDKDGHDLTSADNKDNHGQVIGDTTSPGKTDETVAVQVPKGWKLVDSNDAHTKLAYGDDGHIPTKVVKIEHDTVTVDPSEDVTPNTPIDPQNPDGPKYPKEALHDNLSKIAQRRIVFELPSSTKASDYAKRLKDTNLTIDDTDIDEADNTVIVIEKIAEKRSVIIDAVTGEFKGYVDDNDNDANKDQGWVIDPSDTADLRNVEQNGQFANFKAVLIPQISGYKAKVEVGKTTATFTPFSQIALTPMMVSFMAFAPNPGFDGISGDSNGKVVNNDAKPDDKGDVGVKDVKDLSQKDKDQIMPDQKGDDHKGQDQGEGQPAKGDDHKSQDQGEGQPVKGDDHKGQDQGEGQPAKGDDHKGQDQGKDQPAKGDDHKGQDQGKGQPAKGDDHKSQDQGTNKDDLKGDNTQGQTTQNGGQDAKGDQTPQDANGNQGAAGSTETAKGKGSVDKTNEKPAKNTDKKPAKKTNKKSSKPGHKIANGNSKVSGHKTDKKSAKKAVKNNTTETTKASVQNAVQPNKAAAPVANAQAKQNGNGTVQAATVNSGAKEGTLPQTGETQNNKLGIIGLALASIAGLFGLAGDKKRKRN